MTFKERFKELRTEYGLTQNDCAIEFNLSKTAISQYESGERHPKLETLYDMASFFNVDFDYLTGTSNIKNKNQLKILNDRFRVLYEETKDKHYLLDLFDTMKNLDYKQSEIIREFVEFVLYKK